MILLSFPYIDSIFHGFYILLDIDLDSRTTSYLFQSFKLWRYFISDHPPKFSAPNLVSAPDPYGKSLTLI